MKLISLNVEGNNHLERVIPFIKKESPDCIALMEAPQFVEETLSDMGYTTSFSEMNIRTMNGQTFSEGVLVATKASHTSSEHYYYHAPDRGGAFDPQNHRNTISNVCRSTTFTVDNESYTVVATHVMDTKNGLVDEHQRAGMQALLAHLHTLSSHVLCGDFNMPRGYNVLYEEVIEHYKDTVPSTYKSSLDRNLHRLGNVDIDEPIFDEYMVDYIFTQPPYDASDVHLEFGISDHAAVIGTITKQ